MKKTYGIIMKFGGTSVGSPEAIRQLISIVSTSKEPAAGVVVSAFSKVTNQLIEAVDFASKADKQYNKIFIEIIDRHTEAVYELISDETLRKKTLTTIETMFSELEQILQGISLIKGVTPKTLDTVMSYGERLSAFIICQSFKDKGIAAEYVDARRFVKTDNSYGFAHVHLEQTYKNIAAFFKKSKQTIKVITGFIGSTENDETTTLGRGGSDYTASLFGVGTNASKIEIWTDVDGVLTADPRKVPGAFSIPQMTYQEAMEMSHFGAKVIYPQTMVPAYTHKIPLVIRNTFNPMFPGTTISSQTSNGYLIKGISSIESVSLVLLQGSGMRGTSGIAARLFGTLAQKKVNIILITQASSEYSICFAVDPKDTKKAKSTVEEEFKHEIRDGMIDLPIIEEHLSIIAVIGEQMRKTVGVSGKLFTTLGLAKVNVMAIAQGSSERNISLVVSKKDESVALNAIHKTFFTKKSSKKVSVYLLGTGLIGSTLLEQITAIKSNLQVVAIANSKKMHFDTHGISLATWRRTLDNGQAMQLDKFMQAILQQAPAHSIFVDCTASEKTAEWYPKLFSTQISVVTPNKKANSGSLALYQKIHEISKKSQSMFLYETNVCAGLPVIEAVKNLVAAGDEIETIEGVFSGTLSYIFTAFVKKMKFSDVVKQAQKAGFTEPDPREDLNGMDVGRKLLILAREIGLQIELHDITIENIVPESCKHVKTVAEFFSKLADEDAYFDKLKTKAIKEKKNLRYISKIDVKKKVYSCKLQMVDATHPFYSLSGSDNIVAITSKRYNKTPMVIKGPGAGAEVTAEGVLADMLKVERFYANEK